MSLTFLQTTSHCLPAACAAFLFCLLATPRAPAAEHNLWPVKVVNTDATGKVEDWQALGPLFFKKPLPTGETYRGFRPFYLRRDTANGTPAESVFLYPLYIRRQDANTTSWSLFNLINHSAPHPTEGAAGQPRSFDVWPFWFSRDTGSPDSSYRALMPVAGTIKHRFGYDRLNWTAFPLYAQSTKGEVTTTFTPWPFIRRSKGGGHHGFAFWPLFGRSEKPGAYRQQYYLWPLIYKNESRLSDAHPTVRAGFLPFYTRETSEGMINENFLWPFFGHTRRESPRYREMRYFWPLLVQGRGETQYVNRWAPFYTHSVRKGVEKTWIGWPLIKEQHWTEGDLARTRQQILFFLFWSEEQRSVRQPGLPKAEKTHLWPLISVWDNGAGRRQVQFPSPLEVFFPHNDKVRQLYTPLFALYRLDQRSPEDVRGSLLWKAVTWHRHPEGREFRIGPLFSNETNPKGKRIALGHGLIGLKRETGRRGWRLFLFDFPSRSSQPAELSDP